jgi:hypothetical protein
LLPLAFIAAVATLAQQPIPKIALAAKTIAIRNDTKSGEVPDGALEQLKRWGHFTVVDDTDSADIVLRFDKKTDREKQSSQSTNDDGTTSYSGVDELFLPGSYARLPEGSGFAFLLHEN